MDNRLIFYCWLIGELDKRPMTFQEIADSWLYNEGKNPFREELTKRSFHRYVNDILCMFGLNIECSRSAGNVYKLERNKYDYDDVTEWMLSALRLSSLGAMVKYHSKVLLERSPQGSSILDDILSAIDKHYALRFHYTSAYGVSSEREMVPGFVRLFKGRWYLVAVRLTDEAIRIFAFDRISQLEVVCMPHHLSKETKNKLSPDTFFDDTFGIIRDERIAPQKIRLRVFYPEYNYIEEVPIHHSQRIISKSDDGEYADYEVTVRPTYDFRQELLSHGRRIAVLAPESFRQEMIGVLRDMLHSYETGEGTVDE